MMVTCKKTVLIVVLTWITTNVMALDDDYILCWHCHWPQILDIFGEENHCKEKPMVATPFPNVIGCNVAYNYACYTQNIAFENGTTYKFSRGCKPNATNECFSTSMTSCTTFCEGDLCNGGETSPQTTIEPMAAQCYDCQYVFESTSDPGDSICPELNLTLPSEYGCNYTADEGCHAVQQDFLQSDGVGVYMERCLMDSVNGSKRCVPPIVQGCINYCDTVLCNDRVIPPDATKPTPTEDMATIECYSCSYEWSAVHNAGDSCLADPASGVPPNTSCNITDGEACYTHREDMDSGTVKSFSRGCDKAGTTQCYTDEYYTCDTYCKTDYCNYGDGYPTGSTAAPSRTTWFIGVVVLLGLAEVIK